MDNKTFSQGAQGDTPVKELKWMAEFLATHGQPKKALEIYRALANTMSKKDKKVKPPDDESTQQAA